MSQGSVVLIRQDEYPPVRSTTNSIDVADDKIIKLQEIIRPKVSKVQCLSIILSSPDKYAERTTKRLSIELGIPCEFHGVLAPIHNLQNISGASSLIQRYIDKFGLIIIVASFGYVFRIPGWLVHSNSGRKDFENKFNIDDGKGIVLDLNSLKLSEL